MLTHEAVIWQYVSCIVDGGMAADDVMLHALPLYHCAQLDVFLGPAIYLGATNVITGQPRPDDHSAADRAAPDHSRSSRRPSVWIALLRSPLFDATDLSSLRKGYYGASIMPVEVLRGIAAPAAGRCGCGISTARPRSRRWRPCSSRRTSSARPARPASRCSTSRRAWSTMRCNDVRPRRDRRDRPPLAAAAAGLFQRPEKTAAAFEGGWFHSGDLATVDDEGYITVVDRKKDMIKSGGENVASREVEETIYRLPQVSEVAVIGLPHPNWIEAVTAVVVVKAGHSHRRSRRSSAHCREHMAHFKVPKRVVFADSLPKNPSGKLLKRELRQTWAAQSVAR